MIRGIIAKIASNGIGPFRLSVNPSEKIAVALSNNGTSYQVSAVSHPTTLSSSVWYHVALTRVGTTVNLFVDGVNWAGGVSISGSLATNTDPVVVGALDTTSARLSGYIDELRVTKGYARYTANFTPPNAPFPP